MNDRQSEYGADEDVQTRGNLDLIPEFFQELLDRPEDADPIPEQATVILLPPKDRGDSELYDANMRMARILAAEGQNVVLWTLGTGIMKPLQDHEIAPAAQRSPR